MCEIKDGFSYCFDAKKCEVCKGNCCIGDSGYIWIDEAESARLAAFLGLSVEEFKAKFTDKFGIRYSIKEREFEGGYACVFFDEIKRCCSVYEFRPKQCKTFPFWDYFKKNYNELEKECIGVKPL
ncbi:YkgJ family cysteine cluster protein [Campylobacter geochelonis]|uniref:Flagellin N-methylase n=1 Tax=Campylobacter geochelonis TaxID=1780362 RepID=A0A128EHJ6_9BACT|nr:YkgJ family cysteine cluster protein [Campylobacter geochelonis]QKF71435.1 putative [Fe-S] cluster-containing protein [Campylobacter geochelonis]CZE48350.1 Flagellin N-methylase [Campylobacter geochelonis]